MNTNQNRKNSITASLLLILLVTLIQQVTSPLTFAANQNIIQDTDILTYTGKICSDSGYPLSDVKVSVGIQMSSGLRTLNTTNTDINGNYQL